MPIPEDHARSLREGDATREARRAFDMLETVLTHPEFLNALDELYDNDELRHSLSGTPVKEHFISRGLSIPNEVDVYLVAGNWRISLCITLSTSIGDIQVGAHYDSHDGFGWGC
jgi:hypothetical protein